MLHHCIPHKKKSEKVWQRRISKCRDQPFLLREADWNVLSALNFYQFPERSIHITSVIGCVRAIMIERKQKHWVINKLYNSGWYIWNNSDLRKATNKSLVRTHEERVGICGTYYQGSAGQRLSYHCFSWISVARRYSWYLTRPHSNLLLSGV